MESSPLIFETIGGGRSSLLFVSYYLAVPQKPKSDFVLCMQAESTSGTNDSVLKVAP